MKRPALTAGALIRVALVMLLIPAATGCFARAKADELLRAGKTFKAEVLEKDRWEPLTEGRAISAGQQVRTAAKGSAVLASRSVTFEVGSSSQLVVQTADSVQARAGEILAVAAKTVRISDTEGLSITGRGASLRLTYGERIAVYRGQVEATVDGDMTSIGPMRELTLGLVAAQVRAITPDLDDSWDRRLLADAILIDRQLESYRRTFDVNAAPGPADAAFLARYVQADLAQSLASAIRPGSSKFDLLVVTLIALEKAGNASIPVRGAFDEVVSLRRDGASLGVAAQGVGANPQRLVGRLLRSLTPGAQPQAPESPLPTGRARPRPTGVTSPRPTGSSTPRPTSTPTLTTSPTPTPTPTTSPSPSPSPTETCSTIDRLVGRC